MNVAYGIEEEMEKSIKWVMNQIFFTIIIILRLSRDGEEGSSNKDANMNAIRRNVKWDLKGTCHNKYSIHMLHTLLFCSVCYTQFHMAQCI